jgi:hypothetical protein
MDAVVDEVEVDGEEVDLEVEVVGFQEVEVVVVGFQEVVVEVDTVRAEVEVVDMARAEVEDMVTEVVGEAAMVVIEVVTGEAEVAEALASEEAEVTEEVGAVVGLAQEVETGRRGVTSSIECGQDFRLAHHYHALSSHLYDILSKLYHIGIPRLGAQGRMNALHHDELGQAFWIRRAGFCLEHIRNISNL